MVKFRTQSIVLAAGLFVPLVTFLAPPWLTLAGVNPCWAVLWLLPWALENGPVSAVFAGLCLGLALDAISLGGVSQVPALIILGWWWGRLGKRGNVIEKSLNLGLLALIGSVFLGLSLWIQMLFLHFESFEKWFMTWGIHTLAAQTLITGLIAPIVCSWSLLLLRRRRPF